MQGKDTDPDGLGTTPDEAISPVIPAVIPPADTRSGEAIPLPAAPEVGGESPLIESEVPPPEPAELSQPVDLAAKLEYESSAKPVFWTAGTLVYTTSGIVLLFFWLLWGDFALSMRDRSVGPVTQLFLKSQQASNTTMSLLLTSLPPLISLFLSPIVSYRSDRLRSRWGRRIPYLIIPTPIAALAMVGIAFSTHLGEMLRGVFGDVSPQTATLIVFSVFWTIFEVAAIVSASVLGGLINDVVPRPLMGRFFGLFRAVSLIDGMIFNYFLIKFAETHFTFMFILIATVFGVGFVMMCLKVKEGNYPAPEVNPNDHRAGGFLAAVKIYFRECFSRPHYLWCYLAFTLGAVTFLPINAFSIYYAKQLNMDMAFYGELIAYSYMASLCLAYPLGWLVDKFHPLRVGMVALVFYALTALYGMSFITSPATFGIALVAHTVLSGSYFTATASLMQALLPRSKFAQFASAGGMVTSMATICIGPALGVTLDLTGSNYRLTFVFGFVLSLLTIGVMLEVFRRLNRHGGPKNYVAPGDDDFPKPGGFPVARAGGH